MAAMYPKAEVPVVQLSLRRGLDPAEHLALGRALGEFGATVTFAGSREGVTRTLPLEIYLQRETDPDAAVALALVLVVVAVLVIGLARQGRSAL